MQDKLKEELGCAGYMGYGLIICQANGRPIMTKHLNKRFKDILTHMDETDIDVDDIVFNSIRHTSTGVKLKHSGGDLMAVQGDGGWNTSDMITKRDAHIRDEDRKHLTSKMETDFYQGSGTKVSVPAPKTETPTSVDVNALAAMLTSDPNLLAKVLQSIQFANS